MSGPFSLFPEEVWDIVLDWLADSKDAWNLFRAFPELDMNAGLQKKKHKWLFGLIIPHLIPSTYDNWINKADLLNCRSVSKGWSSFVDIFLQSPNRLRAYNCFLPEAQIPGGFYWDIQHYYLERIAGHGKFLLREKQIIGSTLICDSFVEEDNFARFIQEFEAHPRGRSPFPARFLYNEAYTIEGRHPEHTQATFRILELFGKHIWHYRMKFYGRDLEPQYMARCLGLLPNLMALHLEGSVDPPEEPLSEDELALLLMPGKGVLPHLPYLETLRIANCKLHRSGTFLIRRYSSQIRKLEIDISLWKQEYSEMFPHLTELELTRVQPYHSSDRLKKLLNSIKTPLLARMMLKSEILFRWDSKEFCSHTLSIEADIFPWLREFPNIRYLNIGDEYYVARCVEEGTLSPEDYSITSLKFLSIRTSTKMSYNFLRCLPSLQYLHLHVHPEPIVIDHSGQLPPAQVRILDEIQTAQMYRSNIWELLPKLRTVTLLPEDYYEGTYYTFSREGYEKELEHRNGPAPNSSADDCGKPFPLRPDIIEFLHERKKADRESNPELFYGWD